MPIAYKYCSPRGIEVLRNLELKITPPNQFNDPFEFTPHLICSDCSRYAKRALRKKETLRRLYLLLLEEGRFTGGFGEFRTLARSHRPEMIRDLASVVPLGVASAQREQLDHISQHYGVLCMSTIRDSFLMWGHYSDSHRGLVIGVDSDCELFQREKGLRPVNYVKKRVVFDANWEPGSLSFTNYETQLIFSKNEDWNYEQELRQFFKLSSLRQRKLDSGSTGYFQPVPAEAVVSVTLGVRCSNELAQAVQGILKGPALSHVRLERAALHESDFALTFAPPQPVRVVPRYFPPVT